MRIIRYDESNIKEEVDRCLSCKNPSCEKGCPIHNHIRDFIKALKEENIEEAKKIVYDNSNLAFICSIVCPHEKNCMGHCILNKAKKEPINIGGIEAYITKDLYNKKDIKFNDKKVAIIGSGPAGINLAIELAKNNIKPTIYEEKNHIGGVLSYGIPDFRLSVRELNKLENLLKMYQVEVHLNKKVDNSLFNELLSDYDIVVIASGLTKSRPSGLSYNSHILSASKVLEDYNLKAKYNEGSGNAIFGDVFVMGAGNVAMDVARVVNRLGCNTTIIYRRSLNESPANNEEIEAAKSEGVIFRFLENPVEAKTENNKLVLKIEKMSLGTPDESGRQRPIGTGNYVLEKIDYLIEAIGDIPNLDLNDINNDHGYFITNENFRTNNPKVYAIGDITLGAKTVVEACMSAKICAKDIIDRLKCV